MSGPRFDLAEAKARARQLRAELAARGEAISHSQALERVAHAAGHADWNSLSAALGDRPPRPRWAAGQRVRGTYLGQPFTGRILSAKPTEPGWQALMIDLDAAVDVVVFDSFSNFRKRIRATVGPRGETRERTSNGRPHLVLARADEGERRPRHDPS